MYKFMYVFYISLISIILLFFTETLIQKTLFLIFFLIYSSFMHVKFSFKFLTFGLYMSTFIAIFHYIMGVNSKNAFIKGIDSLFMFVVILLISLSLKELLTNKQLAYSITKLFSVFKIFGFNQNYFYTVLLLSLNQIYYLASEAKQIYNFTIIDLDIKSKKEKIKCIINLIIPFIFTSLKKNKIITISIINKGYNIDNEEIYIINHHDVLNKHLNMLVVIFILEIIILGVL